MGQDSAHISEAARQSAWITSVAVGQQAANQVGNRDYAQIAEQPIDVEQRASVRIVHTSYDALGIRVQKSDRAHRGRGCESARGTRMPTKRCVQLPPAVRMRGKKRMQHSRGIERSGGREV